MNPAPPEATRRPQGGANEQRHARAGRPARLRVARTGRAAVHRDDPRDDDPAAAAAAARPAVHVQHRAGTDRAAGRGVRQPAAGFRRVPHRSATDHAAATVAQHRLDAGGAAQRPHRAGCGRQGDRGVRPLPGRRQFRGRHRGVPDPGGDQFRGHHQGRRPHRRSRRALHPGCDAGQADGHRCRHERRPDHRGGGQEASRRHRPGSRLLRRDGWRLEVCAAMPSPAS